MRAKITISNPYRHKARLFLPLLLAGILCLDFPSPAVMLKKDGELTTEAYEHLDPDPTGDEASGSGSSASSGSSSSRWQSYSMTVGSYGMTPVYAQDVVDGTYEIEAESSSVFFNMTDCRITVEGDEITGTFTIQSESYLYIYPGTVLEAEAAGEDEYIYPEIADGTSVFTIPVTALDEEMDCAAYSRKRKRWYDRKILYDATSLPEEALLIDLPDYALIEKAVKEYRKNHTEDEEEAEDAPEPEAAAMNRSDGEYSIEVNMTGGSGRASISSPTLLTVRDGKGYATLTWSSQYYDYMIVGGHTYLNEAEEGSLSRFTIPIIALDEAIPVIGDTTAMGDPVEIEYTLTFYADTVGSKGDIPQEAAKRVLYLALIVIVAGGIANHFIKKRRYQ